MVSPTDVDLRRFVDHFPQDGDLTLRVLKGHLLVEEQVRAALELSLPNPAALTGEGGTTLTYHQAICLLQASLPATGGLPWVWTACKMLNRIRNDLAHRLDQEQLPAKVSELVQFCLKKDPELAVDARESGVENVEDASLTLTVLALCAALKSLRESLQKRQQAGVA